MTDWPARPEGHTPAVTGSPNEPWWTREAITWLDGYLKPHMHVLEWGAGASTLWLAQRVKDIVSIEHDPIWSDLVRKENKDRFDNYCITTMPLDFSYFTCIRDWMPNSVDAVIVDGRLRVFCCEVGVSILKPGGILVLDNAERQEYAEVHELLTGWPVKRTDNGLWRTDIWTKPE